MYCALLLLLAVVAAQPPPPEGPPPPPGGPTPPIRQCTCAEVEPCRQSYISSAEACVDSCKDYAAKVGADFEQLKKCIMPQNGAKLNAALKCFQKANPNACADKEGGTVPKRFPETLRVAAIAEIDRQMTQSGVSKELKTELMGNGKSFYGCVRTCLDKKTFDCINKLGCGLKLPSDNVIVKQERQCLIQSGIDSAALHEACKCAVQAGVKQLEPICNKITVE